MVGGCDVLVPAAVMLEVSMPVLCQVGTVRPGVGLLAGTDASYCKRGLGTAHGTGRPTDVSKVHAGITDL